MRMPQGSHAALGNHSTAVSRVYELVVGQAASCSTPKALVLPHKVISRRVVTPLGKPAMLPSGMRSRRHARRNIAAWLRSYWSQLGRSHFSHPDTHRYPINWLSHSNVVTSTSYRPSHGTRRSPGLGHQVDLLLSLVIVIPHRQTQGDSLQFHIVVVVELGRLQICWKMAMVAPEGALNFHERAPPRGNRTRQHQGQKNSPANPTITVENVRDTPSRT
ncbi:hypothetical protein GE09DRAFT_25202 [Coniochaeta sp. 2T2.1]|nr:hypothetical protein GE09DRAFT_25202 [Coniochaeta sp. 2T2.1]